MWLLSNFFFNIKYKNIYNLILGNILGVYFHNFEMNLVFYIIYILHIKIKKIFNIIKIK